MVIVAGETGSGKTTQIPKICLELGRGVRGLIGHTQPRRIAARTVAERVAEELRTPLGEAVGWKVRFTDQVGDSTLVKLMTDGILLAEIQTDRELRAYDTIIIDEAHERSLNIDFLLGYLAQLLPRRPDLKVVITSATIDPQRFSRHFGDAPIVEVSGRTYPVEVRYRPLLEEDAEDSDRDQITAICDAVDELQAEGPGDILVFLSGEREIRDTADALTKRNLRHTEVLPLYARLSSAEQHRVFQQHSGRRIVLATNVAETSLTVPGIRYVIDPGTARISRYSHRTKVQRLPIEPVCQASANQRKGRCGRTSDGICIRLYAEDDFLSRPEFTDPEILRTNLASVILQMTAAGLGDIARFPFIDPPDSRNIKDGVQLLEELGALDPQAEGPAQAAHRRPAASWPSSRSTRGWPGWCWRPTATAACARSWSSPPRCPSRTRASAPSDKQAAGRPAARPVPGREQRLPGVPQPVALHPRAAEGAVLLGLPPDVPHGVPELPADPRVAGHLQPAADGRQAARHRRRRPVGGAAANPQHIHLSLLAGLLSHLGLKDTDKNEYLGARSAKFAVFPGSALFKKPPRWIMSAELVETSRLWARVNARIEPEWVEPLAQHLVKRTLQRAALGEGPGRGDGVREGDALRRPARRAAQGELRADRPRRSPASCSSATPWSRATGAPTTSSSTTTASCSARSRSWSTAPGAATSWSTTRRSSTSTTRGCPNTSCPAPTSTRGGSTSAREEPELLNFEHSMLINENAEAVTKADYPDSWRQGALKFRVTYQFEPGADADGVTVHVPLQVLNQVTADGFDWQIPGLREDVVTELIRSLPKPIRRHYVPAPNHAKAFLDRAVAGPEPLPAVLARELQRMVGVPVDAEDFDWAKVPDHLKITFRVIDERRRKIAEDKDLDALRLRLKPKTREAITKAFERVSDPALATMEQRTGLTDWTVGALPRTFETRRAGQPVKAYPALVDEGATVAVRLFDTEPEQAEAMWRGTRRLILLGVPVNPAKFAADQLSNQQKLALSRNPHGSVQALFEDCAIAAADRLIADHGGPAWDEESFRKLFDAVRADLVELTGRAVRQVQQVLAAWHSCERRLKDTASLALVGNLQDVREQLAGAGARRAS